MEFYTLDCKKSNLNTSYINFSRWVKDNKFDRVKLFRGESDQKNLVIFDEVFDKNWYDYLPPIGGIPYCSKRLITILEQNNITGYKKNLVVLDNRPSGKPEDYYWLEITGRCKMSYDSFLKKKKIENWDGNDIFLFEDGTMFILVSEKLKNILTDKKLKITNVKLENLEDAVERWISYL